MTLRIKMLCNYAQCHILFIVMLNVVMLSVVMLSVVAPTKIFKYLEVTDIIVERAVFKC